MTYYPRTKEQKDKDRRKYFAQKNILTATEKKLIQFYEIQWHLRSYVPTIEELSRVLNVKQIEINAMLIRPPVVKALDARGIKWRQHTQEDLTATQVAAAVTMMNFADTRSNSVKLDELGIVPETYYAWLNDPQFKNLVDSLANRNLVNIRPTAIGELTKKINGGDWQAVKYYLDVTGEFIGNETPQSEHLIVMLIEIIQRHVKDPEVIAAIAQDIKLASGNRTLEVTHTPPALSGQVVEDPELDRAKNMLGIQ